MPYGLHRVGYSFKNLFTFIWGMTVWDDKWCERECNIHRVPHTTLFTQKQRPLRTLASTHFIITHICFFFLLLSSSPPPLSLSPPTMYSKSDCGNHGGKRKKLQRFFAGLLILIFVILLIFLLVWAILQPKKPRFVLQDATIYAFNVSSPNLLTSNIQVTITTRNPNDKIGIYYDKLDTYATYRGQQITLATLIPPTYQGHKEVITWSPFIYGNAVPVAPYNAIELNQNQLFGSINLVIKIDGRVRWKVGTLVTKRYHLYVKCMAPITFGAKSTGIFIGNAVKYQMASSCSVSVWASFTPLVLSLSLF